MSKKLIRKIAISIEMTCETGLHIGDSKDNVQIGGLDGPVVRRRDNNQPYIPGSSLKGKMRSLLEQVRGINADGKFGIGKDSVSKDDYNSTHKNIAEFFGKPSVNASRIIVRDCYLTDASVEDINDRFTTDMPYTEQKYENTISRSLGTTIGGGGMRNQERVPAGAVFQVNLVLNVFIPKGNVNVVTATEEQIKSADAQQNKDLALLDEGLLLLAHDYLGGSGSRGYGQVSFGVCTIKNVFDKAVNNDYKLSTTLKILKNA